MRVWDKVRSLGVRRPSLFWYILLISLFNLTAAVYLRQHVPQESPSSLSIIEAPGCGEIYHLGLWSQGHYGGAESLSMDEKAFGEKLGAELVKKMDPFKMLFTQEDVHRISSQVAAYWSVLITTRECSDFDRFISSELESAESRFFQRFLSLSLTQKFEGESSSTWVEPEAYRKFSENDQALTTRVQAFSKEMVRRTTPALRKAFGNNQRLFLQQTYRELLFKDQVSTRNLITKAMMSTLDRFSTYFSKAEFSEFYEDLSAGGSGIGIKVRKVPQGYLIVGVMEGSPAADVNLPEDSIIKKIDGESLAGVSESVARRLFKGLEGTPMTMTLELVNGQTAEFQLLRRRYDFED